MIKKINSFITAPTSVAGLELTLLPDNQHQWRLCLLTLRKGTITIEQKQAELLEFKEVVLHCSGAPIALVINGKNILHKRITTDGQSPASLNDLLKSAIPTLNANDFYVQRYDYDGGVFLSLLRKEALDPLLVQLHQAGLWPLSITLGPFRFHSLLEFISIEKASEVVINSHQLTIVNHEITDYRQAKTSGPMQIYRIGEDELEEEWLLPYAAALDQLVIRHTNPIVQVDKVASYQNEWQQGRIFKFAGWTLMGFFLGILSINFLLFNYFTQINLDLSGRVNSQGRILERIEKLRSESQQREHFLRNAGWLNPTQSSFYADRLASSVPGDIQLVEMNVIPMDDKQSRKEKKPVFIPGVLLVKGSCKDPLVLNSWLKSIHKLTWVKEIKNQNYLYDHNNHTGSFDFQLVTLE